MWGCFLIVWSENTALFERLMEIHSNSPKLYYGLKAFQESKIDKWPYLPYSFRP